MPVKPFDMLIKRGTIVDGGMYPRYRGDIGIRDGLIAAIGPDLGDPPALKTIDARGMIVAPGAIDLHTHFDAQVHWDPHCTPHTWHGVTTALITNCGFGYAPVRPDMRERTMAMMESTEQVPLAAQRAALNWEWETFPEWVEHLKRTPKAPNFLFFIPLNQLMIYVMGIEAAKSRRATPAEMERMKALLNEAMDLGAVGFSFSRLLNTSNHTDSDGTPMPADIHPEEDFYELASELRRRGQGIIQITANVPGTDTREVVEKVARVSGRPILHLVCGPYDAVPEFHRDILGWVDRTADEGLQIFSTIAAPNVWMEFTLKEFNFWERSPYFQRFVYADEAEKLRLTTDPEFLRGAREAYDPKILGGSGGLWHDYVLLRPHSEKYAAFAGRTLGEICEKNGEHIVDVMFDVLSASELEAEFRSTPSGGDPEKYKEVLAHPRAIVNASDGGAHIQTVNVMWSAEYLRWAVRDHKISSLEEMHFKLSGLPAQIVGLNRRGLLRQGYAADLIIYDLAELDYVRQYLVIRDVPGGAYRRAAPAPKGMHWVIINGQAVLNDGQALGPLPGELISNGPLELDGALRRSDREQKALEIEHSS
jgi:N-acyl-D-aspartate/D-glutamate deacylase